MFTSTNTEKKLPVGRLALAGAVVLLYLLLFPQSVPKEFHLQPVSVQLVEDRAVSSSGDFLFQLSGHFGWFDRDGKLGYSSPVPSDLAFNDTKHSLSNLETGEVEVYRGTQKLFTVPGARYSWWLGDRLFVLQPDRMGATEVSATGKILWSKSFTSVITSMDATKNLVVFGLGSGQLQVLDTAGQSRFVFTPGGSRLPVIYNSRLSQDDARLAVLAGVDPKRFILMERSKSEFRPILQKNLEDTSLYPTPAGFLGEGAWVYYFQGNGLNLIRTADLGEHPVLFEGQLDGIEMEPGLELLTLLTRQGAQSSLTLQTIDHPPLVNLKFPARDSFLKTAGDQIFLGADGKILVLKRTRS